MQVLPTYSSLIITHHAGCLSVMGCNLVVGRSNFSGNAAHTGQLGQMVVPGGGAVFASSLKSVVIKDSNFNSNTAILGAVSFMYPHAQKNSTCLICNPQHMTVTSGVTSIVVSIHQVQ